MVYDYFDKYTFLCEMYDEDSDRILELVLNFFPFDNSVQVLNPEKGKNLVRRVKVKTITKDMLQIGNIVNVYAKLLHIVDCVPLTRKLLFYKYQSTFALIKPIPPRQHGKILTYIINKGFQIKRMKNGKISKEFAIDMYRDISGSNMMPIIIDYVTSGEVVGLELTAPNAVKKWRECLGATDPTKAEPGTLRHMFGENTLRNVAHGCNTLQSATKTLDMFFGYEKGFPKIPYRATFKNCTCCVLKPHVMNDGNVGAVIEKISSNGKFYISAMAMFTIGLANSKEFFEVYEGVLPEYELMSIHLTEGKCIALEVKSDDPDINIVCEFRKLCGPRDPELARQIYPDTIRALYGKNIIENAVHCTDLPEDGPLEVEYFFKLVANDSRY